MGGVLLQVPQAREAGFVYPPILPIPASGWFCVLEKRRRRCSQC